MWVICFWVRVSGGLSSLCFWPVGVFVVGLGGLYRVVFRVFELLFWFVLGFGIVLE